MNRIKIEMATPDHIDDLRELTRKLVEGLGQQFDPKRFDWGISRRIYDELQRHGILIAIDEEKDDEVVGMIIAELRIDPFGASEGYIKQVFLKELYRGKGIGELLIKKALEHLQKIKVDKIKVNIKEKAKEAANLYSKMHFKRVYEVLELDLSKETFDD
ncbi:MAG: GNAT family N-acetyltransferase [Candidatus Lokiarchaeota archaeon]|nr:GNAT family N-acetyltransferase [Candidatus Lokiarchaeota archaeon]